MSYSIAIDGPAGAGKSTIARRIAKEMKFIYVDTGAMYRAMALYFIKNGIRPEDGEKISEKCRNADITICHVDGEQVVLLDGENVNERIRTEEVGNMASCTSVYREVREKLTQLQKKIAAETDLIMDGRDIGTCVIPNAQVKIYLTASVETRGQRRFQELQEKGVDCNLQKICQDIRQRDEQDMNREISPLCQAKDAILIDSSYMSIDEVVNEILKLVEEKRNL